MPSADDLLSAGRIGRPHGLDGSFHVTHPRARFLAVGARVLVRGSEAAVVRSDGTEARPIVRLSGRDSRASIEPLRGEDLWVRRADAPPLDEDEWYAEDLEGCAVVDGAREVGTVARLLAYPSCEVLEVRAGERDLLIPLISDAVRDVDVQARRIDVDLSFLGDA